MNQSICINCSDGFERYNGSCSCNKGSYITINSSCKVCPLQCMECDTKTC